MCIRDRFNKFLKEDREKGNFQRKREQTEPEHPEKDVALLTQDGITAYLAWLNKKCCLLYTSSCV